MYTTYIHIYIYIYIYIYKQDKGTYKYLYRIGKDFKVSLRKFLIKKGFENSFHVTQCNSHCNFAIIQ